MILWGLALFRGANCESQVSGRPDLQGRPGIPKNALKHFPTQMFYKNIFRRPEN